MKILVPATCKADAKARKAMKCSQGSDRCWYCIFAEGVQPDQSKLVEAQKQFARMRGPCPRGVRKSK